MTCAQDELLNTPLHTDAFDCFLAIIVFDRTQFMPSLENSY